MGENNTGKPPWLLTKNEYELDEVVSVLQKSIRRGLEEESLYWALELSESGYGQYLWRRLCVIASEDIGLVEPVVSVIINSLAENCKRCRLCAENCEVEAISMNEEPSFEVACRSNNPGVMKWYVDAERCYLYWCENSIDCSTCIKVCPYNTITNKKS